MHHAEPSRTVAFSKAAGTLKINDAAAFDPNKYFDNTWARQSLSR